RRVCVQSFPTSENDSRWVGRSKPFPLCRWGCSEDICKTIGPTARRCGSSDKPSRAASASTRLHQVNKVFPALCLTNIQEAQARGHRRLFPGKKRRFGRRLLQLAEIDNVAGRMWFP